MNKYIKIICLFIFSLQAYAQDDQTVVGVGSGASNSTESRTISVGIQEDLWNALKQRGSIGAWVNSNGNGRSDSIFLSGQLGFEVDNKNTIASLFFGPCIISSPDVLLGGYLQFMSDAHLGIQDGKLNYLGVFYRHISSGGMSLPNVGRDFVGIELRF